MPISRRLTSLLALAALGLTHAASAASIPYNFDASNTGETPKLYQYNVTFFLPTPISAGALLTNSLTGFLNSTNGTAVSLTPSGQAATAEITANGLDTGIGSGTAQTSTGAGAFAYGTNGGFSGSGTDASPISQLGTNLQFQLSGFSTAALTGAVTVQGQLPASGQPSVTTLPYSFSVTNPGATSQVYALTENLPITALSAGATLTNALSGTITSINGTVVTFTPNGQALAAEELANGTSTGVGAGISQSNSGFGPFSYGAPTGFFSSGVSAVPITSLGVNVSFLLSGFSQVSLAGTITANAPTSLTSTPEPSSVAAFGFTGLGVAGLMLKARKRKASETPAV